MRPLEVSNSKEKCYAIVDGDIACTPEEEPSFGYTWNFCEDVTQESLPDYCSNMGKNGVILQHVKYSEEAAYCYILGHYDPKIHEITYALLDETDPTKGISISYPAGEMCSDQIKIARKATVDVECANVDALVDMAQEPSTCNYHLAMKSYYGCPTQCGITKHGLCNSHGHCAFDPVKREPYCYCNTGYSGASCQNKDSGSSSEDEGGYDGFSVQLGLLIVLLLVVVVLVGGVVFMGWQIQELRKHQSDKHYSQLSGGENEMVETTVNFR